MKMTKIFLLIILCFCYFIGFAQTEETEDVIENSGGKTVEERATNQSTKIASKLNLNEDQKAKVKTAIANRITKMQAIKQSGVKGKERGTQMREAAQSFTTEMKTILSPEQMSQLEEMRAKGKGKNKEKRKGKGKKEG
ncbi:MAG: hypothetical protein MUE81_08100 [Thermoflexibacter sp.]|jgi:hypothetical protein|nr:hypothetical protein [Thermoflexibacter sp.]